MSCTVAVMTAPQSSDLLMDNLFLARGDRTAIRHVRYSDMEEFVRLSAASTTLHDPWIYSPRSAGQFQEYLKRFDGPNSLCLLICDTNSESIVGFATVSGIIRNPYHRGVLGYGAFAASTGKGYMTEGLQLVINHCFAVLNLHRLEADIQPENRRSIALARRVRMRREAFSPKFILINDVWCDHERWVIIND